MASASIMTVSLPKRLWDDRKHSTLDDAKNLQMDQD